MHPMDKVLLLNKPRGYTPLQIINYLKETKPIYTTHTLSYAGRLDPMAEGLLLILIDDENKKREHYQNLVKEYTFEILFGISTDTYDVMGKIVKVAKPPSLAELQQTLPRILSSLLGTQDQMYPPYSSFHVKGKPLFYWAREGKLDQVTIPKRKITISSLSLTTLVDQTKDELVSVITHDIKKVKGAFRQEEILSDWIERIPTTPLSYPLAHITITCSSGTYVRSLANSIGEKMGCGALAYKIKRTKVGDYSLSDALPFEEDNSNLV